MCSQNQLAAMTAKIIEFTGFSTHDYPVDKILDDPAVREELEGVIILGFKKDGTFFATSSYHDAGTVLWMLERAKLPVVANCRPLGTPNEPSSDYEDDVFCVK